MIQIMRGDRLTGRAGRPFELDAMVLGESLTDDLLEAPDPAGGQGALPLGQLALPPAQDFPPQHVHGAPPARVEQVGRGVEDLGHDSGILPQIRPAGV